MNDRTPSQSNPGRAQLITQWISTVALLAPLITGMVNKELVSPRLYALGVIGLLVLSAPVWRAGAAWLRAARLRGIIRQRLGASVLGLCRELRTLSDRGHGFSVGSMLSKQENAVQLLAIPLVYVCDLTLRVLLDLIGDITKDAVFKPVATLFRVNGWLDCYLCLYDTVRRELQAVRAAGAISPATMQSLEDEWEEVQQRVSEMRTRYLKLAHEVNGIDPTTRLPEYMRAAHGL